MHHLQPHEFKALEPLLADLIGTHGSVAAVLSGAAEGKVLVDNAAAPSAILLEGPEGLYLGGAAVPGRDYGRLREAIPAWAYLYPSAGWEPRIGDALPHVHFLRHERLYMTARPVRAAQPELDDGFILRGSEEGAFGSEILHGGVVVARCVEDLHVDDRIEIGVWTRPDMRRRGLAHAAVMASLDRAARAGIVLAGWHCLASNRGSRAVAQRAGFTLTKGYSAWSAKLPAENAGDLDAAACRALAERFEQGRGELEWLGFHAAEAWAQAGDLERALQAVETLVAGPWQGQAEWLERSWALEPLRGHPRFEAALALQARK